MHVRAILAIARKDAWEGLRQKSMLFNLALPPLLTVAYLFVSALVTQVTQSPVSLLVYNPSGSDLAGVVSAVFDNTTLTPADSAEQVAAAYAPDSAQLVKPYALGLIIPANFEADLRAGRRPPLTLFVNQDALGPVSRGQVEAAIGNYVRTAADPQSPVALTTTVVSAPSGLTGAFSFNQYYAAMSVLMSLLVGTALIPALLIEEKEKKTLRMLLVMPASYADVIAGKCLVALVYQLAITALVIAITGGFLGFSDQLPLLVLYALLGAGFSLSLGLLFGALFQSAGAASTASGLVTTTYILAGIFVGPWKVWLAYSPVLTLARLFPTYYLADGAYDAWQHLGTLSSHALNLGVLLGSGLILFGVAAWLLRAQAASAAAL